MILLLKNILEVPFCKSRQTYIYKVVSVTLGQFFGIAFLRQANSLRVFRIYLNGTYVTQALVYVHVGF